MLPVLLLFAAVALGSSLNHEKVFYGDTFRIRLLTGARSLTYRPYFGDVKLLWTAENNVEDPSYSSDGSYFTMHKMTPRKDGQYILLDELDSIMWSVVVSVVAKEETYHLTEGDFLSFHSDIPYSSCNVHFSTEDFDAPKFVREGEVQYPECPRLSVSRRCVIRIRGVATSCSGTFRIHDNFEHTALHVTLTVEAKVTANENVHSEPIIPIYGWVGIAVAVALVLCCCVKCCCCKKSCSKKESSNSEEGEAAAVEAGPAEMPYQSEPAGLGGRDTVAPLLYPADPPTAPSAPPIYNSYVSQPPSYEEVLASAEEMGGSVYTFSSTAEPRFEFTGMKFSVNPPLGYETTSGDVYTSNKLSFL